MFNYAEIKQNYIEAQKEYERKRNKYNRLIAKYQRLNTKLKYPHWIELYLTPIAKELVTHFPNSHYEISGPFGLTNETSISIDDDNNKTIAFLQFRPIDNEKGEFAIVDYKTNTGHYGEGSIGWFNGMNHLEIPLPNDNIIEWLLEKVKYFNDEVVTWESAKC